MRHGFSTRLNAIPLAIAGGWHLAGGTFAQDASPAGPGGTLEIFFKLGLPDSRGAKWVKASLAENFDGGLLLPGGDEAGYSGNAWLVREEKNGTVELIVDHTRRVRARRAKSEEDESAGKIPVVQIQDADLDGDLKKLAAALKPGAKKNRNGVRVGGDYLSGDEAQPAMAAGAILLCAHLQHQGRAEQAGALLRDTLAFSEPASALDRAVSVLADGRLRQLTDAFLEKRDLAAYAQAIEKLAGEFPRGWTKRDAALFLARRAREQKPASADPVAKRAADLLLSLKRDQLDSLPLNSNWLFAAPGESPRRGRSMRFYNGRRMMASGEAASDGPASAFFTERRTAFAAVARLLDDHRLIALRRGDVSDSSSSYFSGEMSREERVRREYNGLDRPLELRELAWSLVQNIIPSRLRSEAGDLESGRAEKVLAWFGTIAALSDDDLAWGTLRQSDSTDDNNFGSALGFLVQKGNAASQKLLQDVFLDPAVWSGGSNENVFPQLESYAAKLGPDAAAFGEKLRPIVAAAIKAQNAEQMSNFGEKMPAEQRKMYERQADGELKKFDQIFKPQGLSEMLAELADADKESSMELWQTLQGQLEKVPWAQAEAQLYQLAPKAKDPAVRSGILSLIMQHERGEKKTAPAAPDAATRAALETLLADETPIPEPIFWAASAQNFGDFTALAFVLPRLAAGENGTWQKLLQTCPEFGIGWIKSHARALAAGQPAPPIPDAARVPAGRADEILKEAVALAPEKILATLLAKTPDEQAAVVAQLGKFAEWPPALLAARLTVTGTQLDDSEFAKEFNAERWKGRRFDEAMRKEITEAAEKAALDGHACTVGVAPVGLLGGLKFGFRNGGSRTGNIDKKELAQSTTPLLEGQPQPDAIVSAHFHAGEDGRIETVTFAYALWKNSNLNRAWREKFARPADPTAKPVQEDGEAARRQLASFPGKTNDPAPLDNAVRDLIAGKPAARGQFGLWWMARPVKESEDEPDEN